MAKGTKGKVVQVIGTVVDVEFPAEEPQMNTDMHRWSGCSTAEWGWASVPICDDLWLLHGSLDRLEEKDDGHR